MLNLEKQRQFIIDAGQPIWENSSHGYIQEDDFEYIAKSWNLSPELRNLVGSSGVRSFPMDFQNKVVLDNGSNLQEAISRVDRAISNFFYGFRSADVFREQIKDPVMKEKVANAVMSVSVSGVSVGYKLNKATVTHNGYSNLRTADGALIEMQSRKSVRKTIEKLLMDIFTKEFYPVISETEYFKDMWREFDDRLSELENIVSKNLSSKGKLFLSALPQDLLTMSINDYNWSSCFDADGCNSHMPFEHLRNENTMVAYYIPDSARNRTFKYAGMEVPNKPWRTLVHLTQEGNLALAVRQYPSSSEELALDVGNILGEAFGGTVSDDSGVDRSGNQYFEETGVYINFQEEGTGLPSGQTVSQYDWIDDSKSVCVVSGEYIGEMDEEYVAFRSPDQLGLYYCEECYDYYSEWDSDRHQIEGPYGTYTICDSCIENFAECHYSGEHINTEHGEHLLVIEEDKMTAVYCSVDEIEGLLLEDYRNVALYYVGERWSSSVSRRTEILISPNIERITSTMIQSIVDEDNYAFDLQAFALIDEETDEEWIGKDELFYDDEGNVIFSDSEEYIMEYQVTLETHLDETELKIPF